MTGKDEFGHRTEILHEEMARRHSSGPGKERLVSFFNAEHQLAREDCTT